MELRNGSKNEKVEIAKKMLEEKFPVETIIRITGLTKEDLNQIT